MFFNWIKEIKRLVKVKSYIYLKITIEKNDILKTLIS